MSKWGSEILVMAGLVLVVVVMVWLVMHADWDRKVEVSERPNTVKTVKGTVCAIEMLDGVKFLICAKTGAIHTQLLLDEIYGCEEESDVQ